MRNLKADLFAWYDHAGIVHQDRVGDLTARMMGDPAAPGIKMKDGETSHLLPFAFELCRRYPGISEGDVLLAVGTALLDYLTRLREPPASCPLTRASG